MFFTHGFLLLVHGFLSKIDVIGLMYDLNFEWNDHWMIHHPKTYTPAGNIRSPGYAKVIK